ncbi:hypothetical protein C7974DRAFT_381737 [Boeremia exigua]|uniref:uncharacterized protein n=1 Tax=Boeremia exigua TaxID=749465 RepID=UPI001E8D3C7E|nr:uncharacterized protein C7974DRAFT_381737 [Boeremia exigua]KAH6643539.1 hypothetical protein C7974DRAFT_381737 [Boeremia exigua]
MPAISFETPPAVAQWDRSITHEDYTKMLKGHTPQAMEDKWTIKTDAPVDAKDSAVVHIYFGWTPREEISLEITAGDANKTETEDWATIVKISWKGEHPGGLKVSENEAKIRAVRLCNNLLDCALEEEEEEEDDEDEE